MVFDIFSENADREGHFGLLTQMGFLIIDSHLFSLAPILSVTILQKIKCNQTPEFCYSLMPSPAEPNRGKKVEASLFNLIRQAAKNFQCFLAQLPKMCTLSKMLVNMDMNVKLLLQQQLYSI